MEQIAIDNKFIDVRDHHQASRPGQLGLLKAELKKEVRENVASGLSPGRRNLAYSQGGFLYSQPSRSHLSSFLGSQLS